MKRGIALLLVVTLTATLAPPATATLPYGGYVKSGQASLDYVGDGEVLEVNQTTQKVVIDWERFSVGENSTVIFRQPGVDSAALNRVIGDDPSEILGTLQANGRVFLVNPHGIIFGKDAWVDVGSLVASTLWLDTDVSENNSFWAEDSEIGLWEDGGRLVFEQRVNDLPANVVNMGQIKAHGEDGYIVLLGPALVRNEGSLTASGGGSQRIGLAAGGRVQLTDAVVPDAEYYWDENLWSAQPRRFVVDRATAEALVETAVGSSIDARGGSDSVVLFASAAAKQLHQAVINQQGVVAASRVEVTGGPDGTVKLGGMYGNLGLWDFTMYAEGERIALESEDEEERRVVFVGDGGAGEGLVLNAGKEIVISSDVAYANYTRWQLGWSFFAPTVTFKAGVAPYDDRSQPEDHRPALWIVNKSEEALTVTSDEESLITLRRLQIDVDDGAVVEMKGALDIGGSAIIRGFGSPEAIRLASRHNHFGDQIIFTMDPSVVGEDGSDVLTVGDLVVWASTDQLRTAGKLHSKGDAFLWNDGGDTVLGSSMSLTADGTLTIAATGGGVFKNLSDAGVDVFGVGGPVGRVRIYSSSPTGGYSSGGLDDWEYHENVGFLEDPGSGNVIYFLDAAGALVVVVEVVAPNESYTYGALTSDTPFVVRYYLKSDPSIAIDPDEVADLQLRIVDGEGNAHMPAEWGSLGVGAYDVVGHGARSDRYRLEYVPDQIAVVAAPLTIAIGGASRYYGDDNSVLRFVDVQFSGWARPEDDADWINGVNYTLTSVGPEAPVGKYAITLSEFRDDLARRLQNYDVTFVYDDALLEVRPRPLTVELVNDFARWYGDENDFTGATFRVGADSLELALNHTLADLGFGGDPNEFLVSAATPRSFPGTYAVDVNESALGGVAANYDITLTGELVVTKRPITVGAGHKTVKYLDPVQIGFNNPIAVSDLGQGRELVHLPQRVVVGALPTPVVGEYVVTWDIPADGWEDPVYDITFVDGLLTVEARPIVVRIGNIERIYGDAITPADFTYTVDNIPEATPWFAPTVSMALQGVPDRPGVAFYEGAVGAIVDDANFIATIIPGNLTITQRPIVLQPVGSRIYGELDPSPVKLQVLGLADWHTAEDVIADAVMHSQGTDYRAGAGNYAAIIESYRLINDNYYVEYVAEGNYRVEKRDLWVAVGDIQYHAGERKPYPLVQFDNLAPWDRHDDMMKQGCLMWMSTPVGTCMTEAYGGDVDDPYFLFDRSQLARYRNYGWGRADVYTGPWAWAFHRNSEALRNYNIVESRLGREIVLPALSREEIIDIVLNDRPRHEVFDPETSFQPSPTRTDGEWSGPIVRDHQVVKSMQEGEIWVAGRLIPSSCLIPTSVPSEYRVNEPCMKANSMLDGFTAGVPDESQEILLNALANWLETRKELGTGTSLLSATALAEAYEALKAGDDWVVEQVFPFLLAEFYSILDKDEADLTPGERAFAEHVAAVMHRERQMTAQRALDAYDAWVERNDNRFQDSPNLGSLFTFGQGMPDYLKSAALEAELGISMLGSPSSRKTDMIVGLGSLGSTLLGGGGALLGALGVLEPLVSTVFPFAARAGETAVMLSGISMGGAVLGSVAFVATLVSSVVMELVERENVRRKIDTALERASGPPPSFAELKAMKQSEQGELQLMMHLMTAFDQYAPGGPLDNIAQGWPAPARDLEYLQFASE